jgi:hypothetical protein
LAGLVYNTDAALTAVFGLHGYPLPSRRFFGISAEHTPDKGLVLRFNTPHCQNQGAWKIFWREQGTYGSQGFNAVIFGFIPTDHYLQAGPYPQMSPYVQQLKVCRRHLVGMREQITNPAGKSFIRQQAATRRSGVSVEAKLSSQTELHFSPSPRDIQKLFPIYESSFFHSSLRQQFSGKGPEHKSVASRPFLYKPDGVPALGHGPLPHHFSSDDKRRPNFFHQLFGFDKSVNTAVYARVKVLPVAVPRITNYLEKVLPFGKQPHGDIQLPGQLAYGRLLVAGIQRRKERCEMDCNDIYVLTFYQVNGQCGIQAAGQ